MLKYLHVSILYTCSYVYIYISLSIYQFVYFQKTKRDMCVVSVYTWFETTREKNAKLCKTPTMDPWHVQPWKLVGLSCLSTLLKRFFFLWSHSIKNGNGRSHHLHGVVDVVDHCGILGEVVTVPKNRLPFPKGDSYLRKRWKWKT